jgi:hypothetical protein
MVISTREGLSTINLKTREIESVVVGRAGQVVVGRKSRQVDYVQDNTVFATNLDTRATRTITKLPPEIRHGSGMAVNADETPFSAETRPRCPPYGTLLAMVFRGPGTGSPGESPARSPGRF